MSWRDKAQRVLGERDNRDDRDNSPPIGSIVPIGTVGEATAAARLREWHKHLSGVDQFVSPPGWTLDDWLRLTDTAFALYEGQASYAVRNGWTALDLFGVRPGMPRCGGLADQLHGARNLKLDGGRAFWTSLGVQFRTGIGCGQGCVLLWELDQ